MLNFYSQLYVKLQFIYYDFKRFRDCSKKYHTAILRAELKIAKKVLLIVTKWPTYLLCSSKSHCGFNFLCIFQTTNSISMYNVHMKTIFMVFLNCVHGYQSMKGHWCFTCLCKIQQKLTILVKNLDHFCDLYKTHDVLGLRIKKL